MNMADFSNKTILAVLTVVLVVSVVGTIVQLGKLDELDGEYNFLTGAVTGSGYSNVTIAGTVSLTVNDGISDFGSGYYNASCTTGYARLWTDSAATTSSLCWINTTGQIGSFQGHILINDGTAV